MGNVVLLVKNGYTKLAMYQRQDTITFMQKVENTF